MPKKKVPITELPDKEAIRKLFPPKVVKELDRIIQENDSKPDKSRKQDTISMALCQLDNPQLIEDS